MTNSKNEKVTLKLIWQKFSAAKRKSLKVLKAKNNSFNPTSAIGILSTETIMHFKRSTTCSSSRNTKRLNDDNSLEEE